MGPVNKKARTERVATLNDQLSGDHKVLRHLQSHIIICCFHDACKAEIVNPSSHMAPLCWSRLNTRNSIVCRNQHFRLGFHSCQCTLDDCRDGLSLDGGEDEDIDHFVSKHPGRVRELLDSVMNMKLQLTTGMAPNKAILSFLYPERL